ncbi:acyl-CoA thioesterase [Rhodoferax saidenbachensis]|uniref:Acyl-CoA thioesterase n=1 Tax=Rhodoferax saidenbachensis TaxID=1484693 RepID=A0A1P8KDV7_9BURK|nr:thioesterase family protein [Rhodoferax saidenbachensis]APW44152.1 acyl-CoA thioesterase [Rhodoferax saidenbachensis]
MNMHVFDEAIALQAQDDGSFTGQTHAGYANMVGPFGGTTAAQMLQAVLQHPERLGDPVSLTVNFCAAVADGAFTLQARPARTNRSTQHWTIELLQDDLVVMTATALTAVRRETWSTDELTMPAAKPPQDTPLPEQHTAPMAFVQRYELRVVGGGFPTEWNGGDSGTSLTQLWLRDNPPRPLDFASLASMSDIFFPRIIVRRASPTPVGTVSMTIYFHADSAALARTGTGYLLGQARGQAFHNGFFDQTAQLWNEAGELLVTTHQIVYYKS